MSPIVAAYPSLELIVVNWDKLTLFPIMAVGLTIIGPLWPIYSPYPIFVSNGIDIYLLFYIKNDLMFFLLYSLIVPVL